MPGFWKTLLSLMTGSHEEKLSPIIRNQFKYQGMAVGSSLHHQFQKCAHIPRQSAFINCTCAHSIPRHISPSNLWAEFMNSMFVDVLYLGMCENTYLRHNLAAVLDISLFPPHNVLGHVSLAYLQTRITFQRTWGQTLQSSGTGSSRLLGEACGFMEWCLNQMRGGEV